jgi:hypothetical protein
MLAKNQRAPLGIWFPASSLTTIASLLAPTEIRFPTRTILLPNAPAWRKITLK